MPFPLTTSLDFLTAPQGHRPLKCARFSCVRKPHLSEFLYQWRIQHWPTILLQCIGEEISASLVLNVGDYVVPTLRFEPLFLEDTNLKCLLDLGFSG